MEAQPTVIAMVGFALLADAPPIGDPTWQFLATIIGQVGIGGVLVWHLWFTTSTAIPEMYRNHRDELIRLQLAHREQMQQSHEAHKAEIRGIYDAHESRVDEITAGFRAELKDFRDAMRSK